MAKEVKEKVEEVVEKVKEEVTTKKGTWLNRIYSAAVGAIVAVGAMFGINQQQLKNQENKVNEMKNAGVNAYKAYKANDKKTFESEMTKLIGDVKEVTAQVKKDVETIKNVDTKEVVNTVVQGAKTGVANADAKTETKTDAPKTETPATPAATETKK